MDAFAVALVTGLVPIPLTRRRVFRMSLSFGCFQAIMPAIGWGAGRAVHRFIAPVDHWVAFGLLAFVGARMIHGALRPGHERESTGDPTSGARLLVLSIATSIDALAVGLSLAMIRSPIVLPAIVIGIVAAGMTAMGMLLGRRISAFWGSRVEITGGLILIGIGVKIVLEHMRA
jgi:putative Mn2+ efflux pump MntP